MSETPHTREDLFTTAERVIAQLSVKHLTIEQMAKAAAFSVGTEASSPKTAAS